MVEELHSPWPVAIEPPGQCCQGRSVFRVLPKDWMINPPKGPHLVSAVERQTRPGCAGLQRQSLFLRPSMLAWILAPPPPTTAPPHTPHPHGRATDGTNPAAPTPPLAPGPSAAAVPAPGASLAPAAAPRASAWTLRAACGKRHGQDSGHRLPDSDIHGAAVRAISAIARRPNALLMDSGSAGENRTLDGWQTVQSPGHGSGVSQR